MFESGTWFDVLSKEAQCASVVAVEELLVFIGKVVGYRIFL
jgi:hypothetical protein